MDRIPRVDCEPRIKPEKEKIEKSSDKDEVEESSDDDSSDSESEDGEDTKKKRIKEKVGFRDRKVIISSFN